MSAAANALLTAIHGLFAADAALTALIGPQGLHDRLLPRTALPYLIVGEVRSDDLSTDTEVAEEHQLIFEIWSDAAGRRQAGAIAGRVHALLHDAALPLDGSVLVSLLHRSTRTRREAKSRLHVAEMRFRAVTEQD